MWLGRPSDELGQVRPGYWKGRASFQVCGATTVTICSISASKMARLRICSGTLIACSATDTAGYLLRRMGPMSDQTSCGGRGSEAEHTCQWTGPGQVKRTQEARGGMALRTRNRRRQTRS